MSGPGAEPSLIWQRMALSRHKIFALYMIVFSAFLTAAVDQSRRA